MNKLLSSVGLAIAVAMVSLAGCQLYFGDRDDPDRGGHAGGNPPGFECSVDANCAAGCFCSDRGVCTEAGFCNKDTDCGNGFHCDVARSSCIPNPACTQNEQCAQGAICDGKTCVKTCVCASDQEAIGQGLGWCDEARGTCMTGSDPKGACLGEVSCTTAPPKCTEGQVALVKDGCFTGECREIAVCEGAPVCGSLQHESDCDARTGDQPGEDCAIITVGRGCRRSDGSACQPGDTFPVCQCDEFVFAGCEPETSTTPRVIFQ